ncbi:MAG: methyltransferase domain-containing protein [Candidatus Aminicenantes bacterium]|nr:methyltransferase domain-containing protein [Candidatus Aminicenantes bacterium]
MDIVSPIISQAISIHFVLFSSKEQQHENSSKKPPVMQYLAPVEHACREHSGSGSATAGLGARLQQARRVAATGKLDTLNIRPGMCVADVGAGTGYLTLRLAERVGPTGTVYATDIRRDRMETLARKAREAGFDNIIPLVISDTDPGLPLASCHLVILLHVIHIVIKSQDAPALLAGIKPALKEGGRLILVHWDGPKMGYPEVEAYSKESVLNIMKDSGFELERMETFLPRDTIFIFKLKR